MLPAQRLEHAMVRRARNSDTYVALISVARRPQHLLCAVPLVPDDGGRAAPHRSQRAFEGLWAFEVRLGARR